VSKEICISTTPHETRLAILENDELTEIYYERENEYTLAGSIYKGKVTRVLPGMQSAFVDVGLERDAFLYVTDFLEEQEDSADFESARGNGQRTRRESGRESSPENYARARQPEGGAEAEEAEAGQERDSESPSGTRRWRGRRGRRRGFRSRGQHEERPQLESPEAVEESISAEPLVMPEHGGPGGTLATNRILLPGESLSKYGGAPSTETKTEASVQAAPDAGRVRANYTAPKPSTLIETPLEWDGGLLMPGESLSRYRDRSGVQAAEPKAETSVLEAEEESHAPEAAAAVAEDERQPAVHQGRVEPYGHILETVVEPAEIVSGGWGASGLAPAEASEEAAAVEVEPERDEVEAAVSEPPAEAAEEEIPEEVHEFEPETASASHRVDPAAPSEFRVSSVVEEEVPVAAEDLETIAHEIREVPIEEPLAAGTVDYADEAPAPQVAEVADQLFGFAPGSGVLEEEVIEEEEYDFEPIHRHADEHDSEDLEEETLDHAGELGEMVRDSHLEQRLHSGPALDEAEEEEIESGDVESEEEDDEEASFKPDETEEREPEMAVAQPARPRREGDRRGGRRGDRRGDRRGHPGPRRHSAQTMDLPIISDLLKQGQEILVQIAKEPIAKKGARITSHIALPGRFLVFMPTVNHVGVSRKISSDDERQRLKRILISEKGDASGGFIVRTAADGASEDELRADLRFLISLWNDIRQRADASKAPALIYHDLNLVERVLRDQVSDNFSAIWVDNEMEYERTVRFLNRFQPSLVRRVKLYTKETPLFEQFGIQEEITKALKSKVWLKSGGSIVINQTEALVAIDINTGKYVGKTARLEDTILKTNLDAIPEIVRQIRLRDLGGIIVIDFIDMDERKNRHKVMQALEEALKADRAPSKVLQFNDFGLVAITRKRVKQSLERTLSTPCPICTGTGMVKSPTTTANEIFVEMRKMQRHLEGRDVMLRVNPEVVKVLKANNARWLNELEEMIGKTIIVKSDATLHPEQFDIH
jgi:Rne/Rng family ribonuclease